MEATTPRNARKRRREAACLRCHTYKIKCSGGQPCLHCQTSTKKVDCIYPVKDRKVAVSERYLRSLQDHANARSGRDGTTSTTETSNSEFRSPQHTSAETMTSDVTNPLVTQRPQLIQTGYLSRPVYLGDASGIAFGMKLRELIRERDEFISVRPEHRYFRHSALLRKVSNSFELPEKSYALILIRLVKRFLGDTHHLNLGSAFLDKVNTFYATQVEDPLWICRLFLLFALGELYSNKTAGASAERRIPGTAFFLTAMSLLQENYEEANVIYVETLMLVSLYFDALNRINSAYAYIGLALRVSLTLGLHRNISSQQMPAAEREHRNRVWWTVHYLERLCSSKHGHPMMLRDEDISTSLPSWEGLSEAEKTEFPNPGILIAQLKLAKIVGFISRDMYVVSWSPQGQTFLQTVHSIFTRLKNWNESLPAESKMGSSVPVSRAISSLHLLFNQCVILATRPVLFLIFQQHLKAAGGCETRAHLPINIPPIATVLAENCVHAASNINHILIQLWVDGSIALFGYTDALILFTSTMVLTIAVVLELGNVKELKDETETAWRLLGEMCDYGNNAAAEFYEQLGLLRQDLGLSETRGLSKTDRGVRHSPSQVAAVFHNEVSQSGPDIPSLNDDLVGQIPAGHVENTPLVFHNYHDGGGSRMWRDLDDQFQLASFYLQGDSQTDMRGTVYEQPSRQSVEANLTMGYPGLSQSDGLITSGVDGGTIQDVHSSGALGGDTMLNNMPFGIGLSELDESNMDSMPFLWD